MEQHPVPQQISSYQFRLVGDMTLKQFFQVAGGALVSLLIYSTDVHGVIKWPLVFISFGLGIALAFLPFQERPLSSWILSFFRSVYSPTVFYWKKDKALPVFFKEEGPEPEIKGVATPLGKDQMEQYLKARPDQKDSFFNILEGYEKGFLSKVSSLFNPIPARVIEPKTETSTPTPQKPKVLQVPIIKPVSIASKGERPKIIVEEKAIKETVLPKKDITTMVSPTLKADKLESHAALFSSEAAPPLPPVLPNTIVGQVMTPEGKIIEGAILEIRDLAGRPVRALRTNKAGHFMIVTSLPDGQYDIVIEKEGYKFDPISFKANGEIIPPIAIRASSFVYPENQNLSKSNIKVHEIAVNLN